MIDRFEELRKAFVEKGLTLGAAESFTAGRFADRVCSIPGASDYFKGSVVSYAASVKEDVLAVDHDAIETLGVVSEAVAVAMAQNARGVLDVDVAVSFTGNAGPTAEEGKAQVGETFMAIAYRDEKVITYHVIFRGERNEIRTLAVEYICDKLIEILNS